MSFTWVGGQTPQQMGTQLVAGYTEQVRVAVRGILTSYAPRIEAWMKSEAIWIDRTGNARQGLYAELDELARQVDILFTLEMGYSVFYGRFLELSNAGRYAILAPAVDHFFPLIWADIVRLFT